MSVRLEGWEVVGRLFRSPVDPEVWIDGDGRGPAGAPAAGRVRRMKAYVVENIELEPEQDIDDCRWVRDDDDLWLLMAPTPSFERQPLAPSALPR